MKYTKTTEQRLQQLRRQAINIRVEISLPKCLR